MYKENSIDEFLEKLASSDSMPGGGVASALVAANGASLGIMVCNLTIGKEKYKNDEPLVIDVKNKLENLKKEFLEMMDNDAKEFKVMEEVYKMPKDTDEEKVKRQEALQNACKHCCKIPKELMIKTKEAIDLIESIKGKSNVSAASDLEVGSIFLKAAMAGAWDNVLINLKYIKDEDFKNEQIEFSNNLLKEVH